LRIAASQTVDFTIMARLAKRTTQTVAEGMRTIIICGVQMDGPGR